MKEYIERQKAKEAIAAYCAPIKNSLQASALNELLVQLDVLLAADVVEVRHGRWEEAEDDYFGLHIIKCSACREEWCFEVDDDVKDLNYNYCPNCGCKMDKEE